MAYNLQDTTEVPDLPVGTTIFFYFGATPKNLIHADLSNKIFPTITSKVTLIDGYTLLSVATFQHTSTTIDLESGLA